MRLHIIGLPALAALATSLPARAQYAGYLSVDQVGQQVTRQATDLAGQHGLALASPAAAGPSLWFSTTYDDLAVRPSTADAASVREPRVHTNLSQTLFGGEWRGDQWLAGLAGSVAVSRGRQGASGQEDSYTFLGGPYSVVDTFRFDSDPLRIETEAYSIASYAAFAATRHVILTGAVGYTRRDYRLRSGGSTLTLTQDLGPGWQAFGFPARRSASYRFAGYGTGDTDGTVFGDVAANLVAAVRETGITLAGRLGYRYASTWSAPFIGTGAAVQTAYLGAQAFWQHGRFMPFARIQWEYSNPATEAGLYYTKYPRDALYLSAGLEYRVTDRLAAGLSVLTQEANPAITHRQVALTLRYGF